MSPDCSSCVADTVRATPATRRAPLTVSGLSGMYHRSEVMSMCLINQAEIYMSMEKDCHMLELMKGRPRPGQCELRADGCLLFSQHLHFHHECYESGKGLNLCRNCHFKVHMLPWHLTQSQKRKLLTIRHGGNVEITDEAVKTYIAPGGRECHKQAKRELKERLRLEGKANVCLTPGYSKIHYAMVKQGKKRREIQKRKMSAMPANEISGKAWSGARAPEGQNQQTARSTEKK